MFQKLATGDRFRIIGYEPGYSPYRQKLLAMGMTRGVVCQVVKVAPFGDPLQISLRGYTITLRREEANALEIEVLS